MTKSPATPPTKRKRQFVVVTIALLVIGFGWWYWPRVDERFVGTWTWFANIDPPTSGELVLGRNGSAICTSPGERERRTNWDVDGHCFLFGDRTWKQSRLVRDLEILGGWFGLKRYAISDPAWTIERIAPDEVVLIFARQKWTLTRKVDVGASESRRP